ncbi:MAG: hypothetical protein LBS56_01440 [Propionibacteriaceae bacterium]|jgi:hypothetical protein|nr:hypothetical protein [Propionibacteriaceae bacterium]
MTADGASARLAAPRIPFTRLVLVELRKSFNTRSARTVLAVFLVLGLLVLWAGLSQADARPPFSIALTPAEMLGPAFSVIGILVMTTEWGHQTASLTFRLVPQRHRVLGAKVVAALALATATAAGVLAVCGAVTAVYFAAAGVPITAEDLGSGLRALAVQTVMMTLLGLAWGALVMSTPVAIIICFVVSLALDAVLFFARPGLVKWLSNSSVIDWLGRGEAFSPGVVTSFLLWYALPLAGGIVLQTRREAR